MNLSSGSMSTMFRSVEKYVKTVSETASANADSLLSQAKAYAPPLPTVLNPVECSGCKASISAIENLVQASGSGNKCRICYQVFCQKCLTKTAIPVPNALLHESFRPKIIEEGKPAPPDDCQFICNKDCPNLVAVACMNKFRKEMEEAFAPNFERFLAHEFTQTEFFDLPSDAGSDTTLRQAIRFVQVVEVIVDFTSFSKALKAMKYAFIGTNIINVLITGDLFPVLSPMMVSLKRFGITGPSALLRLYYLGCRHTLLAKQRTIPRALLYTPSQPGVLLSVCPTEVLDYCAAYVSGAQWLYISRLPPPHEGSDWSSWYLSKMIHRQGWTLLMCINDTTKLANGAKCPAFAVIARCSIGETKGENSTRCAVREIQVLIRGSVSTMDWSINFEEAMTRYSYSYFRSGEVVTATDVMHYGVYKSALGILDGYNVRPQLLTYLSRGYEVKIVGHSLGAAVASCIAAELRSSLIDPTGNATARLDASAVFGPAQLPIPPAIPCPPLPWNEEQSRLRNLGHHISAVVFSCPAYLGVKLADAMLEDRLLVNVVNGSDPVPRFCYHTLSLLADEMKAMEKVAGLYMEEDAESLKEWASALGKVADISSSTAENKQARMDRMRKNRERAAKRSETSSLPSLPTLPTLPSLKAILPGRGKGDASDVATGIEMEVKSVEITAVAAGDAETVTVTAAEAKVVEVSVEAAEGKVPEEMPGSSEESVWERILSPDISAPSIPAAAVEASTSTPSDAMAVVEATATEPEKPAEILTVTPGPIIHLYRENNGTVRAAVVDYKHELFQRIELLPTRISTDHDMKTYRSMIDGARYLRRLEGFEKLSEDIPQDVNWKSLFPDAMQRVTQRVPLHNRPTSGLPVYRQQALYSVESAAASPVSRAPAHSATSSKPVKPPKPPKPAKPARYQRTDSNSSFLSASDGLPTAFDEEVAADPPSSTIPPAKDNLVTLAERAEDKVGEEDAMDEDEEEYTVWTPCSVCGLEVTWPYIAHSEATRGIVTHTCSACGKVVCTVCAPAGDQLPGDGLTSKHTLEDLKLAMPSLGVLAPARVCVHCYSDSSFPGLTTDYLQSLS